MAPSSFVFALEYAIVRDPYGYPFVEKIILFPLNFFCTFVKKNQLDIFVWIYFWIIYSV